MHFTYESPTKDYLQQGDLIRRTDAVDSLLKEIHPHYHQSKNYQFFIILTQTCDLVKRVGQPCKSRYITIAAVRPLQLALSREIQKYQKSPIEQRLGFCSADSKYKVIQFMERLLNNNATDFFYLHREPSAQLTEDHCAFLHLSVAIKSELHYQTLVAARALSLTQSFQHKLGYLVGTLYSRIGTDDWSPDHCTLKEFKNLVTGPLEDQATVLWVDKVIHEYVMQRLETIPNPSLDDLKIVVTEARKDRDKKRDVLKIVSEVLVEAALAPDDVAKIRARLENRPDFKVALKAAP
jgi:hypothetical protein